MGHIETVRRARMLAVKGRPRPRWSWLLAIVVNLALFMVIVLMAEGRFAALEYRIETMPDPNELTTAARGEMGKEMAGLRSEMAKLQEANTDEADLRDGLAALGERVDRIEGMVFALWRTPTR